MSEFIGSRISLVSKSDIRYVGILHEINSEKATVALEQVQSFGTEGRRGNPDDEIAPSDSVYEYIVFRGSDVKDLRIEEPPRKEEPPAAPPVLNDPAILGSARPAVKQSQTNPSSNKPTDPAAGVPRPPPFQQQQHQQYPPPYPPYGPFQHPQHQRFGSGPTGPYAFPQMPPPPGPFNAPPFPPYGPSAAYGIRGPPPNYPQGPNQYGPQASQTSGPSTQPQQAGGKTPAVLSQSAANQPLNPANAAAPAAKQDSVPSIDADGPKSTAPPISMTAQAITADVKTAPVLKQVPTGPKTNRIAPVMPLGRPAPALPQKAPVPSSAEAGAGDQPTSSASGNNPFTGTTEAATAAVATAMARLQPNAVKPRTGEDGVAALTQGIQALRADASLHRGGPNRGVSHRGRGQRRGGMATKPLEVPKDDFDFETANAKFNKQDLVKEAIGTGSPLGSPDGEPVEFDGASPTNGNPSQSVIIPPATGTMYNKSTSFFDNISSDVKEKDSIEQKPRPTAYESRTEERRRNIETFGMGSVDSGYGRNSYRGRGRGRGHRGRAGYGRGRGRGSEAIAQ